LNNFVWLAIKRNHIALLDINVPLRINGILLYCQYSDNSLLLLRLSSKVSAIRVTFTLKDNEIAKLYVLQFESYTEVRLA
jgi:hypothetical protein